MARYRDAIRLMLPHYWFGGTMHGDIDQRFGDISQVTLSRNGRVVGTAGWPQAQFSVPASDAKYELRLEVQHGAGNYMDLSSSTDTTWTFRSKRRGEGRTVLPLVQLDYDIDADGYNRVDASSTYPLRIETGYQPGFNGPGGSTSRSRCRTTTARPGSRRGAAMWGRRGEPASRRLRRVRSSRPCA